MSEINENTSKRRFSRYWLLKSKFGSWIRDVPLDDRYYHCKICNKDYSCKTGPAQHAASAVHVTKSKIQETSNNVINDHDYCAHHQSNSNNMETQETDTDVHMTDEEALPFETRKKAAEIRYAAFVAQNNISFATAAKILKFFQEAGIDSDVLKHMTMAETKCKNVISNVLCPIETEHVAGILQNTKFSIFIDETSDITNAKWMTFHVRFVNPETLHVNSQLVRLIDLDAKNCGAKMLFEAFKREMYRLQIPFNNIVSLSCDNAHVMTGKHLSFKQMLQKKCKNVLTLPCPCHSVALVANNACEMIPAKCEIFLKSVANYVNSSPKRAAIFRDCFQDTNRTILKLSETRWLSRHLCITRILEFWNNIEAFFINLIRKEKNNRAQQFLIEMQNPDLKAYFLFLKNILQFFNSFSTFFQALETRIQLLQPKSVDLLKLISDRFVRPELLLDVIYNIDFSQSENQLSIDSINVGNECKEYLDKLLSDGHTDVVKNIRMNCLKFYVSAAEGICKRLPVKDPFLSKLKVFQPHTALRDNNRQSSFNDVCFVAQAIGGFDTDGLRQEWFAFHQDFTETEKDNLFRLNFDEMWEKILHLRQVYPHLQSLVHAVRSLPNSNADSERIFSFLPDVKTKKRNKLSSVHVNAICVVKSALQARRETALNLHVTDKHLSLMSTQTLYPGCLRHKRVRQHATDNASIAGPSSSTDFQH